MLERKDLPSPEQAAAVVDQVIVIGFEHIDLDLRQVKLLEHYQALIGIIEDLALALRDNVPLAAVLLLALLITEVISLAYLRIIVHILCPKLHLGKTPCLVIVECYMHRPVT